MNKEITTITLEDPEIPTDKLIHIAALESQPIASESISKIIIGLLTIFLRDDRPITYIPFHTILEHIDWSLEKSKGSFPKRLGKVIHQCTGLQLKALDLAKLGTYATVKNENREYFLDIANKMDWKRGNFGDGGSCMWTMHKEGLDYMTKSNEYKAIRFFSQKQLSDHNLEATKKADRTVYYRDEEKQVYYEGSARAWLWSHKAKIQQTTTRHFIAPIFVVFNGYGFTSEMIAKVFANWIGYASKPLEIQNKRQQGTHIYINGDGYLVAPKQIIDKIQNINFKSPI